MDREAGSAAVQGVTKGRTRLSDWTELKELKFLLTNKWIKKMWYIHIHTMRHYSAIKKNEIMPFAATWIDLGIIILSEGYWVKYAEWCLLCIIVENLVLLIIALYANSCPWSWKCWRTVQRRMGKYRPGYCPMSMRWVRR